MGLYKSVLDIATPYFGLGAQKFIDRQIRGHLSIEPEHLDVKHLDELAKWCVVSGKLILQDDKATSELSAKILRLKK